MHDHQAQVSKEIPAIRTHNSGKDYILEDRLQNRCCHCLRDHRSIMLDLTVPWQNCLDEIHQRTLTMFREIKEKEGTKIS